MGGHVVDVEVVLLHVLAVVALGVGQPEQPLLEDRVVPVPQTQGETHQPLVVADAREPVLTPAVGARAGLVMGEVVPCIAVVAVVLTNGPPLTLAEVGAPLPPAAVTCLRQAQSLSCRRHRSPPTLLPSTDQGAVPRGTLAGRTTASGTGAVLSRLADRP